MEPLKTVALNPKISPHLLCVAPMLDWITPLWNQGFWGMTQLVTQLAA